MAAPPPYWKKKTRPCPFYSQGRCLFSDACNFVHSVKVTHEQQAPPSSSSSSASATPITSRGRDMEARSGMQTPVADSGSKRSSVIGGGGLSRTPSEKRRRVVLMSPPRSPRLSGLLSALEEVIGPDVEEVEITDDEDEGEEEEELAEGWGREGEWGREGRDEEDARHDDSERPGESVLALDMGSSPALSAFGHSSTESISLAYYQDSPAQAQLMEQQDDRALPSDHPQSLSALESNASDDNDARPSNHLQSPTAFSVFNRSPSDDNDNANDAPTHAKSNSSPVPSPKRVPVAPQSPPHQRLTLRSRVPSPIITQHLDRNDGISTTTIVLDDNTLEVHSHPPRSHQYQDDQHPLEHGHNNDLYHHSQPQQHLAHDSDRNHNHTRSSIDDPLTPSRGSRRHSTFALLTSPFTSPAQRIASLTPLSPQLFSAVDQRSSTSGSASGRPYADDDVDSLETFENSESMESMESTSSSSFNHRAGSDETAITMDSFEVYHLDEKQEGEVNEDRDVGSPHETERPSSEYFRTPRPSIHVHAAVESEIASLPPLPPSAMNDAFGAQDLGPEEPELEVASSAVPERLTNLEAVSLESCSPVADQDDVSGHSRELQASLSHPAGAQPGTPKAIYGESEETVPQTPYDQESSPRHEIVARQDCVPTHAQTRRASKEIDGVAEDPCQDGISSSETVEKPSPSSTRTLAHDVVEAREPESIPTRSSTKRASRETEGVTENLQDGTSPVEAITDTAPCSTRISVQDDGEVCSHENRTNVVRQGTPQQMNGELEQHRPRSQDEEADSVFGSLMQDYTEQPSVVETTFEEPVKASEAGPILPETTLQRSSLHLAPIATSGTRNNSLESPATLSFGPSPVTPDYVSVEEAIVESQEETQGSSYIRETIFERRTKNTSGSPKRLSVVSVTSPTKEIRESFFPASLERTVRPSPSPLYEESQHSASDSVGSSSAVSSPRPSWTELQKRSGVSTKVPFGFRQSLLVEREESPSLSRKLASHFSSDSSASRTSSASSLSPTSAFQPRRASRVDMLSGRARSVSPALNAAGPSSWRHSVATPHSNSAPTLRPGSSTTLPHSASRAEFFVDRSRSESPVQLGDPGPSSPDRRASWMKPLRLSQVYSSASSQSRRTSLLSLSQSNRLSNSSVLSSQDHVRNTSQGSPVQNTEPSSARSSLISAYLNDTSIPSGNNLTIVPRAESTLPSMESVLANLAGVTSDDRSEIEHHQHSQSTGTEAGSAMDLLSPLSGSMRGLNFEELSQYRWPDSNRGSVIGNPPLIEDVPPNQPDPSTSYRQSTLVPPTSTTPASARAAAIPTPSHAIATPRPTLMFAIASDDPAEVERVLASGEARPNDVIGPQSALEFALTNDALVNKTEIVKTLLAYGADVSSLSPELRSPHDQHPPADKEEEDDVLTDLPSEGPSGSISKRRKRESALNPAMKYYLNRATAGPQAAQPSAALRRSDFRSLARMRFDFIGQDRALEHLYWVLGMHSQQPIGTPLVVLCCGPNGHGKSLLARKFGSLLNVPTHTVNMTVLKTSHDLWQCPSMSPYDPPSDRTLAEFLEENAGKRCVVVLDEIDKNEDERTLWSLLAPWELGRCSIDSGRRHIDVRNVIWLGTSNLGQDLVFAHHASRTEPDTVMSKAEYRVLMNSLRPLVTDKLGTSLMSRVTAVLPFVPFTSEEKLAIAAEAILALGGEEASELGTEDFERLALQCVSEYIESDGARSLYRSVSTHLMEAL